jgi:hypothetical protein
LTLLQYVAAASMSSRDDLSVGAMADASIWRRGIGGGGHNTVKRLPTAQEPRQRTDAWVRLPL